ncbi:MAG TPA: response regulator, partial [Chloroflexota bacterium]|nr:response regulator [Chloroflexota bacterium]
TMLRQLLIVATSFVLHGAQGGSIEVAGSVAETQVRFDVSYRGVLLTEHLREAPARELWAEGERLLRVLRGAWALDEATAGAHLSIGLTRQTHPLLVIDDNPDMVQMITRFVSGQGYTVAGAGSVDEGIALAQSQAPSVIILDVMMPGRDGWDALQVLKNHPVTQSVPVLVCTILADSELALALGAQGFLRKPITRPRLLASLQDCTR